MVKLYKQGQINQKKFAQQSNISERQVRRILKRHNTEGIIGLQHKGKNKPSNHHIDSSKQEQILLFAFNHSRFEKKVKFSS